MIDVRVSFGRVICMVGGSWSPVVAELALGLTTAERHLIIVVRVGQNSFLVRAANSLNSAV
jgi:hypothetical protein